MIDQLEQVMGQSESRSLARFTGEDFGHGRRDTICGGGNKQIQVVEKRDLGRAGNRREPVHGRLVRSRHLHGEGRDGPIVGSSGQPMRVNRANVDQEKSALDQSVPNFANQKKDNGNGSQQTALPVQDSCCCCHLDHSGGKISQQHVSLADRRAQLPLEVAPASQQVKPNAKRRQTKESWLLEELDLIAGRSVGHAARERKTIVRIARGLRVDQNSQPGGGGGGCIGNGPARLSDGSLESNSETPAKLGASESVRVGAHRDLRGDLESGLSVRDPIKYSHERRDHVTTGSGGIKSCTATFDNMKQCEQPQQQQATVNILSATDESGSAPGKSGRSTTQAGPATATNTSTQNSARNCECIGTAVAGGSAAATNLAADNKSTATGPSDKHQAVVARNRRTGSFTTRGGTATVAEEAQASVAEVARSCASADGEISVASESGQKSGACQAAGKVQASIQTHEELTSDERAKGDRASDNSEQQSAAVACREQLVDESAPPPPPPPPPADCRKEKKKKKKEKKQLREEGEERQHQQVPGENSRLAHVLEGPDCARPAEHARRLAWSELATKYGRMTRKGQMLVPPELVGPGGVVPPASGLAARSRMSRLKDSCFCHIVCALLQTIFPICGAFKDYSLPGDLFADLAAGFTVAILHIPQGMAYGLLSGVEPIHGLYVSFIPVLIMSLMSKSRHASYGTFAIISMLLVNTIQQVRAALREEQSRMFGAAGLQVNSTGPALVMTDNHRPAPHDSPEYAHKDLMLTNLVVGQSTSQIDQFGTQNYHLIDRANLVMAGDGGGDQLAAGATSSPNYAYPSNIEILSCVCIVCGIVHVTMSLMRLGVLSLMFSDQLISSFTTAGAVHVLTSQLPGLFDLNLTPIQSELFKCMRIWWQFTQALVYDGFNQTTGLLSLASIAFLLFVKELIEPRLRARFKRLTCLPSELILMAIVISCSSYFKLATNYQVKIVGQVPSGLPAPRVPRLELVPYVIKDAISIALITFAMNLSIAQVYAKKFRYELNANQELFALGSANIISSFFSCFPCASSLSRSSIQSNLNVKSQLCSLFSCCIVVTIICYFAHILHDLPKSTLSCIILVALKGILMQLRDLYDNWRLSKLDALVWILTFVSVLIFGVTYGLILGIIASIFMIFLRLLTPQHSVLARLPGTDIFVDKDAFADCEEIEHVKIFRFNSALCYLNRTRLKSMIEKLLPGVYPPTGFRAICAQLHTPPSRAHPFYESTTTTTTRANEASSPRVSHLIIDCSALSYCDYSGATTLVELVEDLEARKVAVYLAACPLKLIDMLEKIQGQKNVVSQNVYPTISDALGQISYLARVVVMPTVATFQEKRAGSSLTSSSMSRSSEPSRQQASGASGGEGGGGGQGGLVEEQQTDKRPSILFAPNKAG